MNAVPESPFQGTQEQHIDFAVIWQHCQVFGVLSRASVGAPKCRSRLTA